MATKGMPRQILAAMTDARARLSVRIDDKIGRGFIGDAKVREKVAELKQ